MQLTKKQLGIGLFILIVMAFFGWGKLLDQEAEFASKDLYVRNTNGVIKGLESKEIIHHYPAALLLLHGFGSSPVVFDNFINAAKANNKFDIYVPLLPYHGRDLQIFAKLNNEKVIQFTLDNIKKLSQKYKQVTVLGFSYSGSILVELLKRNVIPTNVKIILYSPAIYIKSNNFSDDILLYTYSLWRKYCNYVLLGCPTVNYSNGDSYAHNFLEHEKKFHYVVVPAVKQLYRLDRNNRKYVGQINRPYDLIIAADDNRVSYGALMQLCYHNKHCNLHAFPSGRHYLLLGKYKNGFNNLVIKIAAKKLGGNN